VALGNKLVVSVAWRAQPCACGAQHRRDPSTEKRHPAAQDVVSVAQGDVMISLMKFLLMHAKIIEEILEAFFSLIS
jgi:hypothetical protein